ncbi:hypothetical protein CsatB_029785 [Cannabis sativa]
MPFGLKDAGATYQILLTKPPILSKPLDGKELGIYLAITEYVVSVVSIREENNVQHPVYYFSKRIIEAEGRYPLIEKLTYYLILAMRKLRPYFQAHPVRFLKWAIELGQYEIIFQPQIAIKGQALADFVVKCTSKEERNLRDNMKLVRELLPENNEKSTYLEITRGQRVRGLGRESDGLSKQDTRPARTIQGLHPQEDSKRREQAVEALARLASSTVTDKANLVLIQFLEEPTINCSEEIKMIDTTPNWMAPIAAYLNTGELLHDRNEARKMMRKVARYIIVEGVMYRRGFSMPLLRWVTKEEAPRLLCEVRDGFSGNHAAGESLSKKILRQGYFWPIMMDDSKAYVKKCVKCQRFSKIPCALPNEIIQMQSPWPFAIWGIA